MLVVELVREGFNGEEVRVGFFIVGRIWIGE